MKLVCPVLLMMLFAVSAVLGDKPGQNNIAIEVAEAIDEVSESEAKHLEDLKDVPKNYAANYDYAAWKDFSVGSYIQYKCTNKYMVDRTDNSSYDEKEIYYQRYTLYKKLKDAVVVAEAYWEEGDKPKNKTFNDGVLYYVPKKAHKLRHYWLHLSPLAQPTNLKDKYTYKEKKYPAIEYSHESPEGGVNNYLVDKKVSGHMVYWKRIDDMGGNEEDHYELELMDFSIAKANAKLDKMPMKAKKSAANLEYDLWKQYPVGTWVSYMEGFGENLREVMEYSEPVKFEMIRKEKEGLVLKVASVKDEDSYEQDTYIYYIPSQINEAYKYWIGTPNKLNKQHTWSVDVRKGKKHKVEHWDAVEEDGLKYDVKISRTIPGGLVSYYEKTDGICTAKVSIINYGIPEKKE